MYVRATVLREDGAPAADWKLEWRVPAAGAFAVAATGLVDATGTLSLSVADTPFGAHLGVGDRALAAAPQRFDGKTVDFGTVVVYAVPRGEIGGVAAAAYVSTTPLTKEAAPLTKEAAPLTKEAEPTRALADTLVSAGTQIEAAKAATSTVSLSAVTVRFAGTAGAEQVEATWKEAYPTMPAVPASAPAVVTPELLGVTSLSAARKAARAGLRLDLRPQFTADPARHGRVVRQVPAAGQPAPDGVVVAYVARGEGR